MHFGCLSLQRTRRRGFQEYVVGQLRECAKNFYNEVIEVTVQEDLSTDDCEFVEEKKMCCIHFVSDTRIMFRVDFNNEAMKKTTSRLMKNLELPDITSSTFFMVN